MRLNGTDLVDRRNRPSVDSRVALEAFFTNAGELQDPFQISGVSVFKKTSDITPSTVLNANGLISSSVQDSIVAHFEISAVGPNGVALEPSNYSPAFNASGIYRIKTGHYVVVLDGLVDLSGLNTFFSSDFVVRNSASSVGEYFEVWTVRNLNESQFRTVINDFSLDVDTFVVTTEQPIVRSHMNLRTKKIQLGEKRDIKLSTEFAIENKDIEASLKNLMRQGFIRNASMRITKINHDRNLPSRVEVSGFTDTSATVDVTGDNTLVFNWDTEDLRTHPELLAGNLGSMTGHYEVVAQINIFDETIHSPRFALQVL